MTHQFKTMGQFQKELLVELAKDDLKVYIEKAENILGRELKIDGFRKGKISKDQLKKNLNPATVLETALDVAVRESLASVIKTEELDVINFTDLEIKENTPDKLVFKVLLTVFPDIKIKDMTGLKVNRNDPVVDEKEVEDTLNTIKNSRASYIDKDTSADNGDRVELDFEIKTDNSVIEGGVSKNHPLILGEKHFIPGFEEGLVGLKKDEEKSFSLVAPKDYYRKDIAGKKLDFNVKINKIQSVKLPELNDEFAKTLGKFNSVSELVASVKDGLLQEKKLKEQQRVRLEILNQIIKTSSIAVPDFMLTKQLDSMIQDFDNNLHSKGMELGLYLAHIGKTQDELKQDWKEQAENQVKTYLILHKIAKDKEIIASSEEIDQELNVLVQSIMTRGGTLQDNVDIERIKEDIAEKIANEKTLIYLEKECVV
ncbi:MAG: trigger factor [Candidatus Paceibacterota bacterium]